jgi:carbonic anhydrase
MSNIDRLLKTAESRKEEVATPHAKAQPRLGVAILTCMDARIDVFRLLGLRPGDAHVIRNAGGLVTNDAIRSLVASQWLLDTEEILVIMHEGCGLEAPSDDDLAERIRPNGVPPLAFLGAFEDTEAALRDGLERLRTSQQLKVRDKVRGFIYYPETGSLRDPEAAATARGAA